MFIKTFNILRGRLFGFIKLLIKNISTNVLMRNSIVYSRLEGMPIGSLENTDSESTALESLSKLIWNQRFKERKMVCTQRKIDGDPIDYTQHPFLYQYAVSKPLTGKTDRWIMSEIAEKFLVPAPEVMLSIGSGMAYNEEYFANHGYAQKILAYELSNEAVQATKSRLINANHANIIDIRNGDVLEENLPNQYFDVVYVQAAIHHFFRIEQMFELIYRVLRPSGLLIFDEYIGPDHHIYDDEIINLLNEINDCLAPEFRWDVLSNCTRNEFIKPSLEYMLKADPSEGVHSSRILPLTYQYFDVIYRNDYGGTVLRPFFTGILPNFDFANRKDRTIARLIILIEQVLTRNSIIPHYHSVVVGRKRPYPLSPLNEQQCTHINYSNWQLIDTNS